MIKVELPTSEARRLLEELEARALQLEGELNELHETIASIKAQLNGRPPEAQRGFLPAATEGGKNKKGQNLRSVQSYLESFGDRGATAAEITKGTKLGASSVYVVLTRHTDVFTKGDDNLWRLKK